MEKKQDLIIWTTTGQTLKFENVRDFSTQFEEVSFTYSGVSTGAERQAVFNTNQLLGHAISIN